MVRKIIKIALFVGLLSQVGKIYDYASEKGGAAWTHVSNYINGYETF